MIVDNVQTFEMGRVVNRTFGVLQRNAMTFLALSARPGRGEGPS